MSIVNLGKNKTMSINRKGKGSLSESCFKLNENLKTSEANFIL